MSESNYIFPKSIAGAMNKIDQKTQYEASMLSMIFMMIGLALSLIYVIKYVDFKMWFKIVTVINGLFGLLFMFSYVVTTFQQYKAYMNFKDLTAGMAGLSSIPTPDALPIAMEEKK